MTDTFSFKAYQLCCNEAIDVMKQESDSTDGDYQDNTKFSHTMWTVHGTKVNKY